MSIFNKSIQKLDAGALDKIILDNSIVKHRALDWREFIKIIFLLPEQYFCGIGFEFYGYFPIFEEPPAGQV